MLGTKEPLLHELPSVHPHPHKFKSNTPLASRVGVRHHRSWCARGPDGMGIPIYNNINITRVYIKCAGGDGRNARERRP
jgi:hypothetical protein